MLPMLRRGTSPRDPRISAVLPGLADIGRFYRRPLLIVSALYDPEPDHLRTPPSCWIGFWSTSLRISSSEEVFDGRFVLLRELREFRQVGSLYHDLLVEPPPLNRGVRLRSCRIANAVSLGVLTKRYLYFRSHEQRPLCSGAPDL